VAFGLAEFFPECVFMQGIEGRIYHGYFMCCLAGGGGGGHMRKRGINRCIFLSVVSAGGCWSSASEEGSGLVAMVVGIIWNGWKALNCVLPEPK
jgi:hypothetical protein